MRTFAFAAAAVATSFLYVHYVCFPSIDSRSDQTAIFMVQINITYMYNNTIGVCSSIGTFFTWFFFFNFSHSRSLSKITRCSRFCEQILLRFCRDDAARDSNIGFGEVILFDEIHNAFRARQPQIVLYYVFLFCNLWIWILHIKSEMKWNVSIKCARIWIICVSH